MDFYAQNYIYPYFHQSWALFVPPPNSKYCLIAEYDHNGRHRTDIFNEIVHKHQTNRLKGYGPLVIAFTNCIHYFEKNTSLNGENSGPVIEDLNFKILEHAAINYLKYTHRVELVHVRLTLLVENVVTGSKKLYFN